MDIEKLKLTDEEIRTIQNDLGHGWAYVGPEHVANAQLAKALWVMLAQLHDSIQTSIPNRVVTSTDFTVLWEFARALEAAGIPRPEGMNVSG